MQHTPVTEAPKGGANLRAVPPAGKPPAPPSVPAKPALDAPKAAAAPKAPAPAKKAAATKPAAKKAAAAKPAAKAAKGKAEAKPTKAELDALKKRTEVDVSKLSPEKAMKRLEAIYKKEKAVEKKQASFDLASRARRAAKAELEQAQDELAKEIQDQRFGPGPLFNADGSGPAGAPQEKA